MITQLGGFLAVGARPVSTPLQALGHRHDQSLLSGETALRPGKSSSQSLGASHPPLTSEITEQSQHFGCMCYSRSWPLYAVRRGLREVQQRYVARCGLAVGRPGDVPPW
jgi:hypothetical protein